MSTPLELATTAATSIVASMATKAWDRVREKCVTLLRSHLDTQAVSTAVTRLDEQQHMLVATPVDARDALAGYITRDTFRVLDRMLTSSPEAAEPLRALLEEARSATVSGESVASEVRVENVRAKGDVVVGGRDAKVEKKR